MLLPLFLCALALSPPQDHATPSWPHLRGPRFDGSVDGAGVFARPFRLEPAWSAPLGPAYSGVAVADGRAITLFSNGERDFVVALDAGTGAELWRFDLGPAYLGHDGSEDGGISSPVIADGRVFVVGPRGNLVALAAATGERLWSADLVQDLGAPVPDYGFITTPLALAGRVIVQVGGAEERALCAFDPATGALAWHLGEGEPTSSSPVAMDLCGVPQVVALGGPWIAGVAPADGTVLWRLDLPEGSSSGTGVATALDDERFCAGVRGGLAVFHVAREGDTWRVEERYRSRDLGRSFAAPVHHGGHLYGFSDEFLTCIDDADGRRVWRSRPPGGSGLVLVDDRLVVFGAEGVVAVARATPDGYQEDARMEALEHSSLTWPSFADGHVFVRNSEALASLAIEPLAGAGTAVAAGEATGAEGSAFLRWVRAVEASQDADARIAAFLAEHAELPVVEGDRVHFVWIGASQDVAVTGPVLGAERPRTMRRIAGTDFHYDTFALPPGARLQYAFQVDFGAPQPDPRNPRTSPGAEGEEQSVVAAADHVEEQHFLPRADGPRGRTETFSFTAPRQGSTREVQVWLPPGYDEGDQRYPLVLVHQGLEWLDVGGLSSSLDHLVGERVRPAVVVGLAPIPQWWFEGGGTRSEPYVDMLAQELVPALLERYRLSSDPADRIVVGKESFGMTAAWAALAHPEVFGGAAVLSVTLSDVLRHPLLRAIDERAPGATRFWVGWNRWDVRDPDAGFDAVADSRRLSAALAARGWSVQGGEALDSGGWGGWRSRNDDWLEALLPAGGR